MKLRYQIQGQRSFAVGSYMRSQKLILGLGFDHIPHERWRVFAVPPNILFALLLTTYLQFGQLLYGREHGLGWFYLRQHLFLYNFLEVGIWFWQFCVFILFYIGGYGCSSPVLEEMFGVEIDIDYFLVFGEWWRWSRLLPSSGLVRVSRRTVVLLVRGGGRGHLLYFLF